MNYAIITNNTITAHGSASVLWPDTSFSNLGPNASFLAEVGAVAIRSDAPYDPATEILQSCDSPYLLDGDVFNTIAAPIPPPPPPPPATDWNRFKKIAMTSDTFTGIIASVTPQTGAYLAAALLRAEDGKFDEFAFAWAEIVRTAEVPPEVVAKFVGIASACHLPADFVAALQPREN